MTRVVSFTSCLQPKGNLARIVTIQKISTLIIISKIGYLPACVLFGVRICLADNEWGKQYPNSKFSFRSGQRDSRTRTSKFHNKDGFGAARATSKTK